MPNIYADRVEETINTTGTGTLTLAGAIASFQTFLTGIGNGNTADYCLLGGNGIDWETGNGTYTSSGNTFSRDTIYASSNSGSKISLTGVSKIFTTETANFLTKLINVKTSTKTSNYMVLVSDSSIHFNNIGAAGEVDFTLPLAAVGLVYDFLIYAAQIVKIIANAADKIAFAEANSVSGGNVQAATPFWFLSLECHATTQWVVSSATGQWVVT